MKIKILITALLYLGTWCSYAQTEQDYDKKYKDKKAYVLLNSKHTEISIKKGELEILNTYYEEKKMLHNQTQGYADQKIHFSESWQKVSDIEAYKLGSLGYGKYKKEKVKGDLEVKASHSNSIFYDDNKYIEIDYPKVQKGDKVVLSYEEQVLDPHFLGGHFFSDYIPCVESRYSISFPTDLNIKFKVFNDNADVKINFTKKVEKGKNVYTWTAKKVREYTYFNNSPNVRYYEPHIAVSIADYTYKGEKKEVLGSVENLYAWYKTLVKDVNKNDSKELKQIVDSLIVGVTTKEEKVKKIFYWVQDNIKYVAFEDGLGGFIPREAADVCSKRYGDCKDMASIITTMCKIADIETHLTWIGSRDIPYTYEEVSSPSVDNHMIAAVKLNGEYIFLDATGSHVKFGMPTGFIQGKEALLHNVNGNYLIQEVPVVKSEENLVAEKIDLVYDGKTVRGDAQAKINGLNKYQLTWALKDKSREDQKKRLKNILEKGSNKFLIDDFTIQGLNDRDSTIVIDYTFTIDDYAKEVNGKLYLNPHIYRQYDNELIDVERRKNSPLKVSHKDIVSTEFIIEVPKDYTLVSLPKDKEFSHDNASFSLKYKKEGNKIIVNQVTTTNTLIVNPNEFEDWNAFIKTISKAYNQALVFTKK